ncbi:uncharacterized protein F5Z01DRAFT_691448 [Emericellopsis atlantica]|uniref:Uncharacterized protein n=1 Tax=Emericellopsis atlantica TaxID=2614577 RepID=A0A9P7ZHA7_9HYPO|nr:uncharacterized protein F5Z01DRAFT_691448 [Emericellopsis atlantica]KAG9251906.1 hypothetical protein F5Z01DRAFT_691448 [Emericellopsis atlantica]
MTPSRLVKVSTRCLTLEKCWVGGAARDHALSRPPTDPRAPAGPVDYNAYWQPEGFDKMLKTSHPIDLNEYYVLRDLLDVHKWGIQDSKDPYTWGFTLYSAHLAPHAKERFQRGIAKLDHWLRYRATQTRYTDLDPKGDYTQLDARPIYDKILPSHDLARRFKFDVIDEYPAMETVVAGCETKDGDEDFMAIGQHFTQWVEEHALNILDQYVRNDHCLIVDEKSLRTLEALPEQTPPPGPVADDGNGCFLQSQPKGAWVWMLDREYFQKYARAQASGGSVRLPPYDHPDERRFNHGTCMVLSPSGVFARDVGIGGGEGSREVRPSELVGRCAGWNCE